MYYISNRVFTYSEKQVVVVVVAVVVVVGTISVYNYGEYLVVVNSYYCGGGGGWCLSNGSVIVDASSFFLFRSVFGHIFIIIICNYDDCVKYFRRLLATLLSLSLFFAFPEQRKTPIYAMIQKLCFLPTFPPFSMLST